MQRQKIGDLLKRLVPLSAHDVDEILHEQRHSQQRFGETAIAMGLCRPEHVWRRGAGRARTRFSGWIWMRSGSTPRRRR